MKEKIAKIIQEEIKKISQIEMEEALLLEKIEIPPQKELGDFALPCFFISQKISIAPNLIAEKIKESLSSKDFFKKIEVVGPYLNFFINKKIFAEEKIKEIEDKNFFSKNKFNSKIVIEFPSPNTNKPLHLGHLRNMTIGESVSRILESNGAKVFRVNLYNDRGIHICKSMLAYQELGQNKEPNKKSDHFVGDYYVMYNKLVQENKEYENKAQEMLLKWENRDQETMLLWEKMNSWALKGFQETFDLLNIKYDKNYYESKIFEQGKQMVLDGLKKKIFQEREDGAVFIDLKEHNLDEKILLRPDKTSVYITQDLYLAKIKDEEFNADESIYIVGNEQEYHFKVLFTILKKLGFSKKLTHLSYGMIELPEGKMKSREGTVVDADNLIEELKNLAKIEIKNREENVNEKDLNQRSFKIAISAIKYTLLRIGVFKNMIFNPKESLSFDGDTGPYLLYSYVRANSIIEKAGEIKEKIEISEVNEYEYDLIKKISDFPEIQKKAGEDLNPSIIAHYSYELSQKFNEFYHACHVLNSENPQFRIKLTQLFSKTLKKSLYLLGIDTIEKM